MSKSFKPELAAAVLVEALYTSDKISCEKYGVSIRSIQNYRQRLETDAQFALIFARKQSACERSWVKEAPVAIFKAIRFIGQAADAAGNDPLYAKNPMALEAVAVALRTVAEVHFANQIVSARLKESSNAGTPETDRSEDEYPKQISAGTEYAH